MTEEEEEKCKKRKESNKEAAQRCRERNKEKRKNTEKVREREWVGMGRTNIKIHTRVMQISEHLLSCRF